MLNSSLLQPDDPTWHEESNYSSKVAHSLTNAYRLIKVEGGHVDSYVSAAKMLKSWQNSRMSIRQRMHLYFIFALAQAACDNYQQALFWIDEALPLSLRLPEVGDQAELLFQRAGFNRAELALAEAQADMHDCLLIIESYHAQLGTDGSADSLHVLPHLATYEYFTVDFEAAARHVKASRTLAAKVPNSTFEVAAAEWVQANLYRLRRQPERAFRPALQICETYARESTPVSQERAEVFVAQTSLELAELVSGSDRNALLALALPHIERAEWLAIETADRPGQGLTTLMRAYYARLSAMGSNRVAAIEAVIQLAQDIEDIAVLAQAHSALGDEFTAQGEAESARTCYRKTIDVVSRSELPVLAIPARRALHAFEEFNADSGM